MMEYQALPPGPPVKTSDWDGSMDDSGSDEYHVPGSQLRRARYIITECRETFNWCVRYRPNGLIALQRKARWPIPDDTGHVRKKKGGEAKASTEMQDT